MTLKLLERLVYVVIRSDLKDELKSFILQMRLLRLRENKSFVMNISSTHMSGVKSKETCLEDIILALIISRTSDINLSPNFRISNSE